MSIKTVATNRKAYHNYYISDNIEAGIALTGSEIAWVTPMSGPKAESCGW
jgi:tmRNA-binding protein